MTAQTTQTQEFIPAQHFKTKREKKQHDQYIDTVLDMQKLILERLSDGEAYPYSEFYKLFSNKRRGYLREILADMAEEKLIIATKRRVYGQRLHTVYLLPKASRDSSL